MTDSSLKIKLAKCPKFWILQIYYSSSLSRKFIYRKYGRNKHKNIIILWKVKTKRVMVWKKTMRRRVEWSFNPKDKNDLEDGEEGNQLDTLSNISQVRVKGRLYSVKASFNSFKKYCITNAFDETKDYILWKIMHINFSKPKRELGIKLLYWRSFKNFLIKLLCILLCFS